MNNVFAIFFNIGISKTYFGIISIADLILYANCGKTIQKNQTLEIAPFLSMYVYIWAIVFC